MTEPIKVVVVVDGGNVQAVLSADVPVECICIDYDCDGIEEEKCRDVPQYDGTTEAAYVSSPWQANSDAESRSLVSWAFGLAGEPIPPAPVAIAPSPEAEAHGFRVIRSADLAALVGAAQSYADDLESGLDDGTYEDRASLDAVRTALAAADEAGDAVAWREGLPNAVAAAGPTMLAALLGLLRWAEHTGGWDAPAWRQAERAVAAAQGEG